MVVKENEAKLVVDQTVLTSLQTTNSLMETCTIGAIRVMYTTVDVVCDQLSKCKTMGEVADCIWAMRQAMVFQPPAESPESSADPEVTADS